MPNSPQICQVCGRKGAQVYTKVLPLGFPVLRCAICRHHADDFIATLPGGWRSDTPLIASPLCSHHKRKQTTPQDRYYAHRKNGRNGRYA